ncbi:MAG: hypothetical protein ACOC5D_07065, partial [Thermoplasmatota archaeon]
MNETDQRVICPFCGNELKNIHGLKIHITKKARSEHLGGPHSDAYFNDDYKFLNNGKVKVRCSCGNWVVLNSKRKD